MDERTRNAITASVEAWERKLTIDDPRLIDNGVDACPLCELFFYPKDEAQDDNCAGCPIRERTGQRSCRGTPYKRAADAHYEWQDLIEEENAIITQEAIDEARDDWRNLARVEIEFLKSLLPEDKQ